MSLRFIKAVNVAANRFIRFAASLVVLPLFLLPLSFANAATFSYSQEDFLQDVFGAELPTPKRVWIKGELKTELAKILRHNVGFLRVPYWKKDNISVWVLEEIGKEKLITTAIVLEDQVLDDVVTKTIIKDIKVLTYRESRGWEVKHEFFTDQFKGLFRKASGRGLSKRIDGISGATLSVNALKKQAEIALVLNQHVNAQQ